MSGDAAPLLDRILGPEPPPFAVIHRPGEDSAGVVEIYLGRVSSPERLADIELPDAGDGGARQDVLAVIPYRQIAERGYACADDGAPLLALSIAEQGALPLADVLDRVPDRPIEVSGAGFDIDDETYARTVRRVVEEEIGRGVGANFVLKRSFTAQLADYSPGTALTLFARLLRQESGAYWTFAVHTGDRAFVGATPERHVSLHGGVATMNPISGTYRYPAAGPTLAGVLEFLADPKETDELFMVVDEELKMMARVCDGGGRVRGPHLKEMARLAHTEYHIEGRSGLDPRRVLHETMFAPTVTGSPLESACRVIARHEPEGRGYYSGAVALIGHDGGGRRTLDSAIMIRTAEISARGALRLGVGATLVRHSVPQSEVAETRAKAAGLIAALSGPHDTRPGAGAPRAASGSPRFGTHPAVRSALDRRNEGIAGFWLTAEQNRPRPDAGLRGRRVLVVDAEDTFTAMLGHQLSALGLAVEVRRFDEPYRLGGHDLVVLGPGPGDPRDLAHPKIGHLRRAARALLDARQPFLAVCLSHQVLSLELGFELVRRAVPNQGLQRPIDLFGSAERVGFYNTFAARCDRDEVEIAGIGTVRVCRDPALGEVHALRGPGFASTQFHAESVLTVDGPRILSGLLRAAAGVLTAV